MAYIWDTRLLRHLCTRHLYQAWDDTLALYTERPTRYAKGVKTLDRLDKIRIELVRRGLKPVQKEGKKKKRGTLVNHPLHVMVAHLAGTKCGCDIGFGIDFGAPGGDKTIYSYRIGNKFYSKVL